MVKLLSFTASIGPAVTEKAHWALKQACSQHKYPELLKYFLALWRSQMMPRMQTDSWCAHLYQTQHRPQ